MATEGLIALVENGFDFREKDKFGKTLEELIPMCQAMSCKQIDKVQSVIWNKKDYSEMKKDCETTNKEAQDEILEEKLQEIYDREDTSEVEAKPKRKLSLIDDTPVDMRNSKHEQFEDDIPSRRSTFHDSGGSYDGDNYSEEEYKIFSRLFILNEFSEENLKKLSNIIGMCVVEMVMIVMLMMMNVWTMILCV